nr:protein FAR1-RELATED SEQUENCE 5-like [Coffea arabica]
MEEALYPKIGMEFQSEDEAYNFYNRKVSISQEAQTEIANDAGISLKQSHKLMGKKASGLGNIGYTCDDLKRYLRTKRERGLKYGEAGAMLRYFEEQKLKNPSFFHAEQLDCKEQITNIFWADASMLIDYTYFGDVVTFDTTYKTNKEYRPLGVFVGFNQFRQLIIFGATLLYDETIESFKWVFGTFVEAVCGRHPKTIFTDQDAAMAVLSESLNASIENYLKLDHDLVQFFKHFNRVVDEKRYNELRAEYYNRQKLPMLGLQQTPVLIQATSIYSPCMFVAFQNEYDESTTMVILDQKHTTMHVEYSVSHYDG